MNSPTLSPLRVPLAPRVISAIRPASVLTRAVVALLDWNDRHRQRRMLLEMDARSLRDVGLTRTDAEHEADKPFWRG